MQASDAIAPESVGSAERRESIWSVNERWRGLYFAFFLLLMGAGSVFVVWQEAFGAGAGDGVVQWVVDVLAREASVAVASAGLSLWMTEVVMLSTLLGRKLDERRARLLNEGRDEGRKEGREEGQREGRLRERAEWDAWLERMMAAQSAGEPFAEPPPSRRADDANGAA